MTWNHGPITPTIDIGILKTPLISMFKKVLVAGFTRIDNNGITILINDVKIENPALYYHILIFRMEM